MNRIITSKISESTIKKLLQGFGCRAATYDEGGNFVKENYNELKNLKLFSALIPEELGGLGMNYSEMCQFIKSIARHCGSTALAFSMHQHLIAAMVWKYKHKNVGELTLRRIAEKQLVLVSTGARDWLGSNGEMKRTDGGYLLSAQKHFASQCSFGDIAVTSAPFLNENEDWKVLHFSVPLNTQGTSIIENWDVLGMRGTASNGIAFDNVFVPNDTISLERNRDEFHPVWNIVLTVAMPLIMSVYVGIAERAAELAISMAKKNNSNKEHLAYCIGKLNNSLIAAQTQWEAMYNTARDLDFSIHHDNSIKILSLKTNVTKACKDTVSEVMESVGGQSFYKKNEFERLFRDMQAASFHPLPKWDQYAFTGKKLMHTD